jgi:hypothetical protein
MALYPEHGKDAMSLLQRAGGAGGDPWRRSAARALPCHAERGPAQANDDE